MIPQQSHDPQWIGLFDKSNDKSVYSRSPSSLKKAMEEIPDKVRVMGEEELLQHCRPSKSLCAIRQRFWEEVERHEKQLKIVDIFTHRNTFYTLIQDDHKLMWFLTPPDDVLSSQKSILERSLSVLHKFIAGENMYVETEVVKENKDGTTTRTVKKEINIRAIAEARKIMEAMTDRIHGSVAMNLRVQGQHMHAAVSPEARLMAMDPADLMHIASDDPPVVIDPDAPTPKLAKAHVEAWGDGSEKATKEAAPEDFIADFMDVDTTD